MGNEFCMAGSPPANHENRSCYSLSNRIEALRVGLEHETLSSALCLYLRSIIAQLANGAYVAERLSRDADFSAMPDEEI